MDEAGIKNHKIWTFILKNINVYLALYQTAFYNDHNFGTKLYVFMVFTHIDICEKETHIALVFSM